MFHLRQRQEETGVVESRRAGANGGQAYIYDQECRAMYFVGLIDNHLL